MGSNWLSIDNNMPTITGKESTWQMCMQLHNFLPIMIESLKYQLNNLDASNWNAKEKERFQKETTQEVESAVDTTDKEVLKLIQDLKNVDQRIVSLAGRMTDAEMDVAGLDRRCDDLEGENRQLVQQMSACQEWMDEVMQAMAIGNDGTITIGRAGVSVKLVGNVTINGKTM